MNFKRICLNLVLLVLPALSFASDVELKLEENLFVRIAVPKKGIVCSNMLRAERVSSKLQDLKTYQTAWGPSVFIGKYNGEEVFVAQAPVGSGSGLMFSELYSAGAEDIVRYGSDDHPFPKAEEFQMVKIIDETDNLIGFELASGIDSESCGKSISAAPSLVKALESEANKRGLNVEKRICHHVENYHAIKNPHSFKAREASIQKQKKAKERSDKKESYDMESAVLFRVAKDFGKRAASVLQTVHKDSSKTGPYEGSFRKEALNVEEDMFMDFVLTALTSSSSSTESYQTV
ncbi:MAG: hypothetical protein GWP59_04245 [Chlamydiales bacterium]|nr:hypothetical protein [Chlamydiales bacterium]